MEPTAACYHSDLRLAATNNNAHGIALILLHCRFLWRPTG